jgi:hypothetical protein
MGSRALRKKQLCPQYRRRSRQNNGGGLIQARSAGDLSAFDDSGAAERPAEISGPSRRCRGNDVVDPK